MADPLDGLVSDGTLRATTADPQTARDELEIARRHLASAQLVVDTDPTLAFVALYDAMRKAVTAHMRARGLRVTGGPGQHVKVGRYARAALAGRGIDAHVDEFDVLRDMRNQSEYDAVWVRPADVRAASVHVAAILDAVARDLDAPG